jgi:hypothetical protein
MGARCVEERWREEIEGGRREEWADWSREARGHGYKEAEPGPGAMRKNLGTQDFIPVLERLQDRNARDWIGSAVDFFYFLFFIFLQKIADIFASGFLAMHTGSIHYSTMHPISRILKRKSED